MRKKNNPIMVSRVYMCQRPTEYTPTKKLCIGVMEKDGKQLFFSDQIVSFNAKTNTFVDINGESFRADLDSLPDPFALNRALEEKQKHKEELEEAQTRAATLQSKVTLLEKENRKLKRMTVTQSVTL